MLSMTKKKPERARDRGEVRLVTVELPTDLDDAIEERSHRDMRSKKAVIVLALREYLARDSEPRSR